MYVFVCMHTHVCSWKLERISDLLDLELQVIESHTTLMVGSEHSPLEEQQRFLTTESTPQSINLHPVFTKV